MVDRVALFTRGGHILRRAPEFGDTRPHVLVLRTRSHEGPMSVEAVSDPGAAPAVHERRDLHHRHCVFALPSRIPRGDRGGTAEPRDVLLLLRRAGLRDGEPLRAFQPLLQTEIFE